MSIENSKIIDLLSPDETSAFINVVSKYKLSNSVYPTKESFLAMLHKIYSACHNTTNADFDIVRQVIVRCLGSDAWTQIYQVFCVETEHDIDEVKVPKCAPENTDVIVKTEVPLAVDRAKHDVKANVPLAVDSVKHETQNPMTLATKGEYNPYEHYIVPKCMLIKLLMCATHSELTADQFKFVHSLNSKQVFDYFRVQFGGDF